MSRSYPGTDVSRLPPKWRDPRCLHGGRHVVLALLAVGASLCAPSPAAADPPPAADDAVLTALGRTLTWLEAHPSDPRHDELWEAGLDITAWHLFASLHPDERVRRQAGEELDARLRALPTPEVQDLDSLSSWSVLLRLIDLRGLGAAPYRAALEKADLTSILDTATPTTRWWTAEFLRRGGLEVDMDFERTFVAEGAKAPVRDDRLKIPDAYRLFHELIPATDLGREKPQLTSEQQAFVIRVLPRLIELTRAAGDTDAVAEVLVCAALMEQRQTQAYRDALAWLLRRQHPDGTYATARDLSGTPTPVHLYRHVVQAATWALLTSLGPSNGK